MILKKIAILTLIITLAPWLADAQPKKRLSYTLDAAIEQALRANPTVEQKIAALEKAQMDIGVAQSQFWPRASLVYSTSNLQNSGGVGATDQLSSISTSYGLRISWNLFSGFSHLTDFQISRIQRDIAEVAKRQTELELIFNVKMFFFTYLQAARDVRLAQEQMKRLGVQLKSSEAFVAEELAPYVNVLQNKVELTRGQEQLLRAENAMETARIQLNRLLGQEPGAKIEYKGDLADFPLKGGIDPTAAVERAMRDRPDIIIAQKSVEAAGKRVIKAAGTALPQIDVSFDTMRADHYYDSSRYTDYNRDYSSVGISLMWPFFEGGKTVFSTLSEKKNVNSLEAAFRDTVSKAKTDVLTAIQDVESAKKVYETAKEGIASATEAYAQTRFRYDTGLGTITDLLDAQTKLTQAEVSASKAMADYNIAYSRYLFDMGASE